MINLKVLFEKHDNLYLKDRPLVKGESRRADIRAFNLLDRLVPGTGDMVCSTNHDEIYLEVSPSDLQMVATEEDIID